MLQLKGLNKNALRCTANPSANSFPAEYIKLPSEGNANKAPV